MNLIKKLVLTALLVPSSLIVSSEAPAPSSAKVESIMKNFYPLNVGFKEGIYRTNLNYSPSSVQSIVNSDSKPETIIGNLYESVAGFKEGIYKGTLAASRFILSTSKGAAWLGNLSADHYLIAGGVTTALLAGAAFCYFKRPSRPTWMHREWISNKVRGMWHGGRFWVSPEDGQ
jgi:hypothetical protein